MGNILHENRLHARRKSWDWEVILPNILESQSDIFTFLMLIEFACICGMDFVNFVCVGFNVIRSIYKRLRGFQIR